MEMWISSRGGREKGICLIIGDKGGSVDGMEGRVTVEIKS
jgi:hypothetical protein